MMFTQYAVLGTVTPIIAHFFKTVLGFSGQGIGAAFAFASITSFVSPFVGSIVADRMMKSKRLLSLCNLGTGAALIILSASESRSTGIAAYFIYGLLSGPVIALMNAITFHNATDAERQYAPVRIWGTVGYIAVAWFCIFLAPDSGTARAGELFMRWTLRAGGVLSVILTAYALTLPQPSSPRKSKQSWFPSESFAVFTERRTKIFITLAFLVTSIDKFNYFGAATFLSQSGFPESEILPAMSIGQVFEIVAMLSMAAFSARFGLKKMMCAGLFAEALRFGSYMIGAPDFVIYAGLSAHGFFFAYFMLSCYIWLDGRCSAHSRSGVHQIFSMITSGLTGIAGNLVCGKILDRFMDQTTGRVDFVSFWAVPFAGSCAVFLLFIFLFEDDRSSISRDRKNTRQ
jgi:hypothetical protein